MSTKIYLLKTHRINVTNLILGTLTLNESSRFNSNFRPCTYTLTDKKFFIQVEDNMAKHFTSDTQNDFRNINWSTRLLELEEIVNKIDDQILIFGNHNVENLLAIKNHFGDVALTISTNYDENLYPYLLNNSAEFHVWALQTGYITPNEHDQKNLKLLTNLELVNHYTTAFDSMNLFPRYSQETLDYDINISDCFDENTFFTHLSNIGIVLTDPAKEYYRTWQSFI